jgi:hypothetical protein
MSISTRKLPASLRALDRRHCEVDGRACRATGNHRAAQNDEPEPEPAEQAAIRADLERDDQKGQRLAAMTARCALELQVQHLRSIGGL